MYIIKLERNHKYCSKIKYPSFIYQNSQVSSSCNMSASFTNMMLVCFVSG